MEPTIISGDYVFVNKLAYGTRLFNLFDAIDGKKVKMIRVPGYTHIKNNDVVVLHNPHPNNWDKIEMNMFKYLIKRCVGISGDTLQIKNGIYRINSDSLRHYGNLQSELILSRMTKETLPNEVYNTFPWDSSLNWNIKNFGPLYIPKKGDKIWLDKKCTRVYKKLIEWETGIAFKIKNDTLWNNKKPLISYTFKHNYYFMGGDNVQNSQDSRYWGLLPEEFIVGKATIVWLSKDILTGKIKKERMFKKIK